MILYTTYTYREIFSGKLCGFSFNDQLYNNNNYIPRYYNL